MLEQGDVKGRPVLLHVDCTIGHRAYTWPCQDSWGCEVDSWLAQERNAGSSRILENQTSSSLWNWLHSPEFLHGWVGKDSVTVIQATVNECSEQSMSHILIKRTANQATQGINSILTATRIRSWRIVRLPVLNAALTGSRRRSSVTFPSSVEQGMSETTRSAIAVSWCADCILGLIWLTCI